MAISNLQKLRYQYQPKLPALLAGGVDNICVKDGAAAEPATDRAALKAIFKNSYGKPLAFFEKGAGKVNKAPLNVGVILSGGQAPGGHNVIAGLFDGLKKANAASKLFGFSGGPAGLIENKAVDLTSDIIDASRNTGGFDIIGSGRTKIETPEQFAASLATVRARKLDAVVIIGGDDSNTNAALLGEYFLENGCGTSVIGCPKTIDGDLKNEYIEASFGFDTACKTYAELIGNICRDSASAKKYWHFIKLMGRSASHIALECALQTQPNVCIVSEEVKEKKSSLDSIVEEICASVRKRAEAKLNFGVVLIPEGLVEFVPEMQDLISALNDIMAQSEKEFTALPDFSAQRAWVCGKLNAAQKNLFVSLPEEISKQLLADRDPHGNVQVSKIETEKLLAGLVEKRLAEYKKEGNYAGKFSSLTHFFGYEGRCAFPSNFDADYCYTLGYSAFLLIALGLTGYIACVKNLARPAAEWQAGGVPLACMMNIEKRHGEEKPVIKKALVELDGAPFRAFAAARGAWAEGTHFVSPGAIQYYGPAEVCDACTKTLALET
jgi:pyrophosphate--fructose-6-phosphate 1-phosphotransferase